MSFWKPFGGLWESNRMSTPLRLPNNCQQARDDAADRINQATAEIIKALNGTDPQAKLLSKPQNS